MVVLDVFLGARRIGMNGRRIGATEREDGREIAGEAGKLVNLNKKNIEVYLIGDMNINFLNYNSDKKIADYLNARLTLWPSRWSSGDQTRRSWVQFSPWSEFSSVLM